MNFNHDTGLIDTLVTIDTTQGTHLGSVSNSLTIIGTGALVIPVGTTGQRPTGTTGAIRFNSDSGVADLEVYNGSAWVSTSSTVGTVTSVAIQSNSTTNSALTVVTGSPITSAGTIVLALGAELVGLAGMASTGLVARTTTGTYAERTITGTSGNIAITNGNGVLDNPTINLATVSQGSSGSFLKFTVDTFGRVVDNVAVAASDLNTVYGYTPVDPAHVPALTMNSAAGITFSGGGTATGLPTPTNPSDAASKGYVDALTQGLNVKSSAIVGTTGVLPANTYANGTLGTGATLTASAVGILAIDGRNTVLGDVILVKNEATAANNGLYTVTTAGTASVAYVLTRAVSMETSTEFDGAFLFIETGTVNGATGWVCITTTQPVTVGTTAITFTQFSGAGTYSGTTNEITLSGTVFSLATTMIAPGSLTVTSTFTATSGTIDNVAIGGTTAAAAHVTTLDASNAVTLSPANHNVVISPTGSGLVTINPATAGSINNMVIGGTTAAAGTFTTVTATATTGTAPFTVSSTTNVANLNASSLNGATFAAPGTIGGTTPGAATFTTIASTAGSTTSNGNFAAANDAQGATYVLRNATTNATVTELFLDGSSARLVMRNNSVYTFQALISGVRTDGTSQGAGYSIEGTIKKDTTSGSITVIGAVTKSILGETVAAWDANATVDGSTGAIKFTVIGAASTPVRWVAVVTTAEVSF